MSKMENVRLCVHDVTGLVRKSDVNENEAEYFEFVNIIEKWSKVERLWILSNGIKYSYNTDNIVSIWLEKE